MVKLVKSRLDQVNKLLIPPLLVVLLTVTIIELFYNVGAGFALFVDIFDIVVVIIFGIDLHFRWKELPRFFPFVRKYYLDIIATIPFGLIFYAVEGLALIRGLRGVRLIGNVVRAARAGKLVRLSRLLRLVRFGARAPRFLRMRKQVKTAKIRRVQPHEKKMKKTLSFKVILLITINSIMGTGIWFLTSAGAKHAGPASLVSWGVLSLISVYIAMCFAELTSMFPKAGGVYEFAKQAYGRFWSFVIGWTTSVAGSVTIAMLLLGALQYLIPIEYAFTYIPIAILLIILFSFVAFRGMQTSTVVLVTFALITLTAVIAIIIPGFFRLNPTNFDPFFVFPTMSVALAIFFIAETFFGWESAIFLSAETKNPSKIMPKALIYGTIVIAVLSFLLAFTAMGTIPWAEYSESVAPLRDLGNIHFGSAGGIVFAVLIFISVIGATAGWIVTAPRLLMAIAEDKLFFVQFAKLHPKHKSPYVSIVFQAIVVSALVYVGAGSYETLLHMLIPLILVVYSAVLLSVVILRIKKPDLKRPYRVKFGKVGPFATILFMVFLLIMFIKETHSALDILRISAGLIAFGIPAYFAIELFYDPKYVTLRKDILAKLKSTLPSKNPALAKMIGYVGSIRGKKVVDSNSPLGGVADLLVRGKAKVIHHVNSSKEEAGTARKRLKGVKTSVLQLGSLPNVRGVDVFLSYNDLATVDVEKYLREVKGVVRKGGKVCFYVHSDFLNIAANAVLLDNRKKVREVFAKNGFKVEYTVRRIPLKKDIYIYGKRT